MAPAWSQVEYSLNQLRSGSLYDDGAIERNASMALAVNSSQASFANQLEEAYRAARWTRWRK